MTTLYIILSIILLAVLVGIIGFVHLRMTIGNRYEWLKILNHTEWKYANDMVKEMKQKKGFSFLPLLSARVYTDLERLVAEGLVEEKEFLSSIEELPRTGHRLTTQGIRKRLADDSVEIGASKTSYA